MWEKVKKMQLPVLITMMTVTILIKTIATMVGGNYLYADGANHLYGILRSGEAIHNIDGRQGSFFLMELLIATALKLGVNNIKILCILYGMGSVIWLGVFILLAMHLCKKYEKGQFITILAILYVLVNIFTGFFTAIESITAVGVYCFLLCYYMFSQIKQDWQYRIISLILLCMLPVMNEYFVGYSPVLLLVLVLRFARERKRIYLVEWGSHIVVNILTTYASYMAATQGASTSSLKMSIQTLPEKKYYWILLGHILITLLVAILFGIVKNKIVLAIGIILSLISIGWLAATVYLIPNQVATVSFSMRIMNLVLPMVIGMFCIMLWLFSIDIQYILSVMAILFMLISCVYDVNVSGAYHDYLIRINMLNQEKNGFFELGETDLDRTFCWGWSLPMESFLAQCLQGETVIDSNLIYRYNMQQWEAFDSDNIDAYADLARYGIQINKEAFQQ